MWRRVDLVLTDVSEERITSIFRVENPASEEPAWFPSTITLNIFRVLLRLLVYSLHDLTTLTVE
jgi:hypothetical protein